ncbi:MAG: folylpolyglutamate synthase/dihydrofolate synthase family protein [Nitratireductor sp.]
MSVESQIEKLLANHPKGFDLSLTRISKLLESLGNPHTKIPPTFHIAGTNGKGSTSAFLRAILEANGLSAHVHTSPHLVNWNERYRIGMIDGGKFVSDKALEEAIETVSAANAGQKITVFEIMSAVAFQLFAKNKADYTILEVGLGGRADATNVIKAPVATIITPVALDHQAYLGDTIEKIAFEKAGIIKQGVPVIVGQQTDGARSVIEDVANDINCNAYIARQDFDGYQQNGRFIYQDEWGLLDLPLPKLNGTHQIDNATLAIAALRHAKVDVSATAFEKAMGTVYWPGRFERLQKAKLVSDLPASRADDFDIWIDGGHNPAAGKMLSNELAKLSSIDGLPVYLICAMLDTKDPSGFFDQFKDQAKKVITIPIPSSEAGINPKTLAELASNCGLKTEASTDVESALQAIAKIEKGKARILMCGSLYMVGEVLEKNHTPPV